MGFINSLFDKIENENTTKPFYENTSNTERLDWFSRTRPWNKVDLRIIKILVEKFNDDPKFEVFVCTSHDCNLISKYIPLKSLFDIKMGEVAVCPKIAGILYNSGEASYERLNHFMNVRDEKQSKLYYKLTLNSFESSILVEPSFLGAYVYLASMKFKVKNKEEGSDFCYRGLKIIEILKVKPWHESSLLDIKNTPKLIEDIENKLKVLLKDNNL